jgi:hypothetical protein
MSESLKQCPFCGAQPVQRNHWNDTGGGDGHRCYVIACENKECAVKPVCSACGPRGYDQPPGSYPANHVAEIAVVSKWNDRIEPCVKPVNKSCDAPVDVIDFVPLASESPWVFVNPVPKDVSSLEFATWLTEQYRLAMAKGAQLAMIEKILGVHAQEWDSRAKRP